MQAYVRPQLRASPSPSQDAFGPSGHPVPPHRRRIQQPRQAQGELLGRPAQPGHTRTDGVPTAKKGEKCENKMPIQVRSNVRLPHPANRKDILPSVKFNKYHSFVVLRFPSLPTSAPRASLVCCLTSRLSLKATGWRTSTRGCPRTWTSHTRSGYRTTTRRGQSRQSEQKHRAKR